jgi:hypothetical protein
VAECGQFFIVGFLPSPAKQPFVLRREIASSVATTTRTCHGFATVKYQLPIPDVLPALSLTPLAIG